MGLNYYFSQTSYLSKMSCAALSSAWVHHILDEGTGNPSDRKEALVEFARSGNAEGLQGLYERACGLTTDKSARSLRQAYTPLFPAHVPCDPKSFSSFTTEAMTSFGSYAELNGTHGILFTFSYMPVLSAFGKQTHTIGIYGSSGSWLVFDSDYAEVSGRSIKAILGKLLSRSKYGGKSRNRGCHYLHLRAGR